MKVKFFEKFRKVIFPPDQEQPDCRPFDGDPDPKRLKELYVLKRDHTYHFIGVGNDRKEYHFRVELKAGFIMDGQSAPAILHIMKGFKPDGVARLAWTLHDMFYRSGGGEELSKTGGGIYLDEETTGEAIFGRCASDQVYKAAARDKGLPRIKCRLAYWALRRFGRKHWKGPMPRG